MRFPTDAPDGSPGDPILVIANGIQFSSMIAATVVAGFLMMLTGTRKRVLRWKPADRRCATCGRRRSDGCSCKR
jgi:hypothetical protein